MAPNIISALLLVFAPQPTIRIQNNFYKTLPHSKIFQPFQTMMNPAMNQPPQAMYSVPQYVDQVKTLFFIGCNICLPLGRLSDPATAR